MIDTIYRIKGGEEHFTRERLYTIPRSKEFAYAFEFSCDGGKTWDSVAGDFAFTQPKCETPTTDRIAALVELFKIVNAKYHAELIRLIMATIGDK